MVRPQETPTAKSYSLAAAASLPQLRFAHLGGSILQANHCGSAPPHPCQWVSIRGCPGLVATETLIPAGVSRPSHEAGSGWEARGARPQARGKRPISIRTAQLRRGRGILFAHIRALRGSYGGPRRGESGGRRGRLVLAAPPAPAEETRATGHHHRAVGRRLGHRRGIVAQHERGVVRIEPHAELVVGR